MELEATLVVDRSHVDKKTHYQASWINRFTRWIDAQPGPAWCYYLALLLLIVSVQLGAAWWESGYRPDIIAFAFVFVGSSVYYLTMMHYLDKAAIDAFAKFRPALCISDKQAANLSYELTHLPARTVRILTVMGVGLALLIIAGVEYGSVYAERGYFGRSIFAQLYWRAALIADQILFYNLIYHSIHQLRVVNMLYTKYTKIDLFNLSPLYTFSRLTAYTALGTILIAYLWVATYPWISNDYVVIGSWLVGIVAALAGFILPFLDIHRRLVEEKQHWKIEAGQHLKMSLTNFHQTIADRKLEEVDAMLKMIEGVNKEQAILEQIPTWPWHPGTVRGLTTTIVVPVILWLLLRVLERLVIF